jgi:putative RecB family exonuclease
MVKYSHSRISTYENCPYRYKLQYVDKIKPDAPNTIEAFMGGIIHESLEKLYKDREEGKHNTIIDIKIFYKELWEAKYTPDILIAKYGMTEQDYKQTGWKFLYNYYNSIFLHDQLEIVGIETEELMELPDGNHWHIRIDKLGKDKQGNYFVCDYKTNSRMKEQQDADEDRQLAMYSIWVKNKFSEAKSVKLVWHMLAFNETVISERSKSQEEFLIKEILEKIKVIEEAEKLGDFPKNPSKLCDYCLYKKTCWGKD